MPYTKVQEREYQRLLMGAQFDARPYNRTLETASMPCVDGNYKAVYTSFQTIRHPFILTPGDNALIDARR
jgi:hypothetical protein